MGTGTSAGVLDTREQLTRGDAGGGKRYIIGGNQVINRIDTSQINVVGLKTGALLIIARPDLAEHLPTDAFESSGGQHRLWRATYAHVHVYCLVIFHRGLDSRRDIAVHDETNTGAGFTDFVDYVRMARPVEDSYGDVGNWHVTDLGDAREIFGN